MRARARTRAIRAGALEWLLVTGVKVVSLTVTDRGSILWALDEPPTEGLAGLRAVLRREHEWRVREGLV